MKASLSIVALLASIAMASPTLRSRQINDLPPCEMAGEFIKGGIYTSRESNHRCTFHLDGERRGN